MHTKGEVRAGDRESDDGKRSAPERWVMALRDRATRPYNALCQETSSPVATGLVKDVSLLKVLLLLVKFELGGKGARVAVQPMCQK